MPITFSHIMTDRTCRSFFTYVLLVASIFALSGSTTFAATPTIDPKTTSVVVSDPIKNATVNLYCRLKSGRKIYSTSGSGVVISERGIILTNAHVAQYFLLANEKKGKFKGSCSVRTGSPARHTYNASVLYFPSVWIGENSFEISKSEPRGTGKNDFALLYITDAKNGVLPERFPALSLDMIGNIAAHAPVTIAGYPTDKLDFDEIRNELALIKAKSTVENGFGFGRNQTVDVLSIAPSAAGSAGISGGPVIGESNNVVGIATSKSATPGDTSIRAITIQYIDRTMRTHTALPLSFFLASDPAIGSSITKETVTPKLIGAISSALLRKK